MTGRIAGLEKRQDRTKSRRGMTAFRAVLSLAAHAPSLSSPALSIAYSMALSYARSIS